LSNLVVIKLPPMAVVFTIEGRTKDGRKVKLTITLKKFCRCKSSLGDNCQEKAKEWAQEKIAPLLGRWEFNNLFWVNNQVNPNFFTEVMAELTEVLEAACVTARSDHLQGAQLKIEEIL